MPRVVSFIVLLAIILLIGSMFFQVMVQFIVPLFLAAVLVVIFKPLHQWMLRHCGGRPRIAATLTTLAILLIVLLPLCGLLIKAVAEGAAIVSDRSVDSEGVDGINLVIDRTVVEINKLQAKLGLPILESEEVRKFVNEKLHTAAAPLALGGVRILASTLVGLAIMVLTMFYFFSDGPSMAAGVMKLSPLDDAYEQELLEKFGDVSRAVVVATLLSAVVQGLLAGAGYWFADVPHIFFLTALTVFLAMVPFVGAAAVWVPVCLWLFFYNGDPAFPDGRPVTAISLAIYCVTIVSMIDNLIKPLVLHGQSNLHPLLALLSVIGGVKALGPIGILVGPMLVAFLQALLNMLNKELHLLGQEADEEGTPVVFATKAPAKLSEPLPAKAHNAGKHGKGKRKKK